MKKILIVISIAVFAFGCSKETSSENPVLAEIKGGKITKEDFVREFDRLPEWAKDRFTTSEGKEQFLNEVIKKELLYNKAKKQGLERDKEYQSRLEEFKKMELISLLLKKEIEGKVKVDDAEVKNYFDSHSFEFKSGGEIKVSHILVETEAEAKSILEKIKKGENFAELAKKFSKDRASAQKGGEVGPFRHGQMVPEFEQAAFRLNAGEVSEPVRTRFGYHVIKILAKKEGKTLDFEQVKEAVRRRIIAERQKSIFDSFIEDLKKEGKVKIEKKALDKLQLTKAEQQQNLGIHGQPETAK